MPIQTRNITAKLSNPDGSFVEGALLRVRLVQTDSDAGGMVAPSIMEFTTDESGEVVMELFENNPGSSNSYYQIYCVHPVNGVPIFNGDQFQVPASDAQLKDIINLNFLTPVEPTSEAVAQVAADKIAAANSAAAAAASATAADTSATNSAGSATAASGHADDAEIAKTAAQASQAAAAASATTASGHATTANTKAGEATASATAAANSATAASASAVTALSHADDAETAAATAEAHAATANTKANTATTKATEAAASAVTAGNSATTSTTKAAEAAASAASALTHKNDAETAKISAQNSATAASNSATAAGNSATAAAASENNAGDSAVAAAADRVLSQAAATTAQTAATAAENSEINSASHEEQAETARTQAAAMRDEAADYRAKALTSYVGATSAQLAAEAAAAVALEAAEVAENVSSTALSYEPAIEKGPKASSNGGAIGPFTWRWVDFSATERFDSFYDFGDGSILMRMRNTRFDDDGGLWRMRCDNDALAKNPLAGLVYAGSANLLQFPDGLQIDVTDILVKSLDLVNGWSAVATSIGLVLYDAVSGYFRIYETPDILDLDCKAVKFVLRDDSPRVAGRRLPDIWLGTSTGLHRFKANASGVGWSISTWTDTSGSNLDNVTHIAQVRDRILFSSAANWVTERAIDEVLANGSIYTRKAIHFNTAAAEATQPWVGAIASGSSIVQGMSYEGIATNVGLMLFRAGSENLDKALRCAITNSHNTGFRPKTAGNWLCDNLLTTLTGATVPIDRGYSGDNMTVAGAVTRSVNGVAKISYANIPDDNTNYLSAPSGVLTAALTTGSEWCLTFGIPIGLSTNTVINSAKVSNDPDGSDLVAESGVIISVQSDVVWYRPFSAGALQGSALSFAIPTIGVVPSDLAISVFQRSSKIFIAVNGVIYEAGAAQAINAASSMLNFMVGNLQMISYSEYAPTDAEIMAIHHSMMALMPSDKALLPNSGINIIRYERVSNSYLVRISTSNSICQVDASTGEVLNTWTEATHGVPSIVDIAPSGNSAYLMSSTSESKKISLCGHVMDGYEEKKHRTVFSFDGDSSTTIFMVPVGMKPTNVWVGGAKQRIGSSNDYVAMNNGTQYYVKFSVAPGVTDVEIEAESYVYYD